MCSWVSLWSGIKTAAITQRSDGRSHKLFNLNLRLEKLDMATTIAELVDKIARLENQLVEELKKQQDEFHYTVEDNKIKFEQFILDAHRKLKVAILPWLKSATLRNIISSPFIYSMVIPIAFMDLTVTIYQNICFRLYGISLVKRSKYVVMDRHKLAYLNGIEKFNCLYCGYGNGVIAYTREIIARTEQYWCPIKHARRVVGTHRRYADFVAFGDAEGYHTKRLEFRERLKDSD